MDLAHWAALHRRSILFFVVLLSLSGLFAGSKLPVALFPHVNFPRVVVSVEAGDRPADQMAIMVTRKIEQPVAVARRFLLILLGATTWCLLCYRLTQH